MKLNYQKVATSYGATIGGENFKFGWYESGKAFIAKDGELLSFDEAWRKFVPKRVYTINNSFYVGQTRYDQNMSGIVHYLRDKYCR